MKRLVIFDVDGTLFKGDEVTVYATNRACDELGVKRFPEEYIKSLIGEPGYVLERIYGSVHESLLGLTGRYELDCMDERGGLFEGAEEILRKLHGEGYTLVVCSLAPRDYLFRLLKRHGIWEYFAIIKHYTSGIDKTGLMGELLSETPHASAVMVGDRVFDIDAAREHGIPCVGVSYGYGGDEVLMADIVINSLRELPEAVRKIIEMKLPAQEAKYV